LLDRDRVYAAIFGVDDVESASVVLNCYSFGFPLYNLRSQFFKGSYPYRVIGAITTRCLSVPILVPVPVPVSVSLNLLSQFLMSSSLLLSLCVHV